MDYFYLKIMTLDNLSLAKRKKKQLTKPKMLAQISGYIQQYKKY